MKMYNDKIVIRGVPRIVVGYELDGLHFVSTGKKLKVVRLKNEWDEDIADPRNLSMILKDERVSADIITFSQRLPESYPRFQYPMEWENIAALPLTSYDHWFKYQLHQNPRNKILKARKAGVDVRRCEFDDNLVEGILRISNESPNRQGKPYWHYGVTREKVKELWSTFPERSVFLGAYFNDQLIGYVKLVSTDRFIRTMGFIAMIKHRDKAPMNALLDSAVRYCTDQNAPYLVFAKYNYGKVGSDTLMDFKKYNGFESVILPRYFVPLSLKGKLAVRFGLHKGVIGILPRTIVKSMRHVRNWWYG